MYRARELRELLASHNCEIVAMSAANYLSVNHNELLKQNPQLLQADFLQWELDFSAEDGCVDGGTHIITIVKKV